ncbi:mucin-6-like [Scomber scombrus]|uniref:Mucin-6-like n=1 Tax=Scomber scombrus TaxID=13677 RepID=A0AAV1NUT4_SCOSC
MALSQLQCLDDNHVNPRTHESKPEFFYCEDQRLALEALLRGGREAFAKYLEARGLRGFLSDPEQDILADAVEPYDPGLELFREGAEENDPPLSLHYWPDLSDTSIPQLDLGWPDSDAYRGVTRATVYAQPPLDGQAHIKEVVRKMIAQAQKVIAVVMDVFTDVDIFRDLLDAGFKRKVSVYILLEGTMLPHFLSMCQRANMHAGHLKNLRVRCSDGAEFYTRSCTKVKGRMGHRFMFIDGDKAVSGSYSFTWMSSRLDRNLITVVTGQAVETFDRLFCFLYTSSSSVDLRQVATEPEPEPEPVPQLATVAPPSAEIARKLYSPMYALISAGTSSSTPAPSASDNNPKESQETKKKGQRRAHKEAIQEAPPLHPGLTNLEKACLISYVPTWPEPDPPSDVIGFINVRDTSKPIQVGLQRSQMFETSQAIRFSSPLSLPKETLPGVAKPRQSTGRHEEMNKSQPTQESNKVEEPVVNRPQPTQLNVGLNVDIQTKAEESEQKSTTSGPVKGESLNTETHNLHANTPTNQDADNRSTSHINSHTPPQSKVSTLNTERPSQTVTTNSPEPDSLPESNANKGEAQTETCLNTQSAVVDRTYTQESDSTQTSQLSNPTDSNSNAEEQTQTKLGLPQTDSHTQAVHTPLQSSSEITPNRQNPAAHGHISSSSVAAVHSQSVSSTSESENNCIPITTVHSSMATNPCTPLPSISSTSSLPPPLTSSSTTLLPSSSTSSPILTPPIPKPRTVQLVIKDGSNVLDLPKISIVKRPQSMATTGPQVAHSEPAVQTVVQIPAEKESVLEMLENGGSNTGEQKDNENAGNLRETEQQKQSETSPETKVEEAVGINNDRAETQMVAATKLQTESDVLIIDSPTAEFISREVEPNILMSTDCNITLKMPETDCLATAQTETKATAKLLTGCELAKVPNEESENMTQHKIYLARANEPQRVSYCELNLLDVGVSEIMDFKALTDSPVPTTHKPHVTEESTGNRSAVDTYDQQGNSSVTSEPLDGTPNTKKNNTQDTSQAPQQTTKAPESTHTPEKPLRLRLSDMSVPDLRSQAPEIESPTTLVHAPTPDGFLTCMSTSSSRTNTPDLRPYTPDFRTPTPDVSDGYFSPREDSTPSSTSEEYYECSDSPFHDHDDSMRKQDDKGSLAERSYRTEQDFQVKQRRGSVDAKKTAGHLIQGKDLTQTVEKEKEAQSQAPKRKRALNKSTAETLVDRGLTAGESTHGGTEPKRLSTGDLKLDKVSFEGEKSDKVALRPSSVERRDRPRSTRGAEGQKSLHSLAKPPRAKEQQQDSGASSSLRSGQLSRSHSAPQSLGRRPKASRPLNQAESKALHSKVVDDTSSPHRPPFKPAPPLAAAPKHAEASQSQQSPPSQQHPAAQGKKQNQHPQPKPSAASLQTQSNMQQPLPQNQTVSAQEANGQEAGKGPFGFSFSRLYSLKGLKDKMSKLPAPSKRSSSSSPAKGRKSKS